MARPTLPAPRAAEAALTASLLWVYIGCRTTVRVIGALQSTLPR